MTLTELRDTLASVHDAVPVPVPDVTAFQRRVTRVRRRRATVRVAGAVAAVAVLASGSTMLLGGGHGRDAGPEITERPPSGTDPGAVPVVVGGHLRVVSPAGALGPDGPAVESIVGTMPHGVVVLTEDETLSRLGDGAEQLQRLVPGKVGRAYIDGGAVVYQSGNGLIQWWGVEPVVRSSNSAQTDGGLLMAATTDRVVVGGGSAGFLGSWDDDGHHELVLHDVTQVSGVETAGEVIAVQTEDGVVFFSPDGQQSRTAYVGERVGALSPDGEAYAQQTGSRAAVELLDPATLRTTPVVGPAGAISDVGWAPDGDLLAVVDHGGVRTLWRCSPDGTGCAAQLDDPSGTLRLR